MGVRPPQQNDDDAPEIIAFGIAALDEHLEQAGVEFPVTTDDLLESVGDPAVPYDAKGNTMQFSAALESTDRSNFETRQELMNALHPVFEAQREHANNSVFGRIRSILPF